MKNYYKILQVDKDASPEIIKVAYKLLVKKNHPDLKEGPEKKEAEEKIKQINEAYEILYDTQKRAEYDQTLLNDFISPEQYQQIISENINLKNELNYLRKKFENNYYNSQYNTQYTNGNDNDNSNNSESNQNNTSNYTNYKKIFDIEYLKNCLTEKVKSFIALIITLLLFFIIIKIPFIRNILPNFINSEYIILIIFLIIGYYYFFKNKE